MMCFTVRRKEDTREIVGRDAGERTVEGKNTSGFIFPLDRQ